MKSQSSAPKLATFVICLVLYVIALLSHFGVVSLPADVAPWTWIIGFGLLLLSVRLKDL